MQKFSDEELVLNYCISCMGFNSDDEDEVKRNMLFQTALLSRLERGRRAIEAIEELSKELGIVCAEVLQGKYEGIKDFANAYPITFDEGKPILKYLTLKDIADRIDYQQSEEAEG